MLVVKGRQEVAAELMNRMMMITPLAPMKVLIYIAEIHLGWVMEGTSMEVPRNNISASLGSRRWPC